MGMYKPGSATSVLVLRPIEAPCFGGFPESYPFHLEAPEWSSATTWEKGMLGHFRGEGIAFVRQKQFSKSNLLWQVFEVEIKDIVELNGAIKFRRGKCLYSGNREKATKLIQEAYPEAVVIGATLNKGQYQTASVGDYGFATAGFCGSAVAGHYGWAVAGDRGKAMAGTEGSAIVRNGGQATAGYFGFASAGESGHALVGDYGTAEAGYAGIAVSGFNGLSKVGDYGEAITGPGGTVMAGEKGRIIASYHIDGFSVSRTIVGYIGRKGLLPHTPYAASPISCQFEINRRCIKPPMNFSY